MADSPKAPSCPPVLGLFQKRIEGDDALLRLAKLRFEEAGLGAEFYAETTAELAHLLDFRPETPLPSVAHLPRWIDLFDRSHRQLIGEFAEASKDRIMGLVIHDQGRAGSQMDDYTSFLRGIDARLQETGGPFLFVEYAHGLDPEVFCRLFEKMRDLGRISCCVDVGHLAIRLVRDVFGRTHPGLDIFSVRPETPELPDLIDDLQAAVQAARPLALPVIARLCRIGKRMHLHLHDGHPLSTASPFGVSDHLGFSARIPLPFSYQGRNWLDPIFGPAGLAEIIRLSLHLLGSARLTFSLEVHPEGGRLPLGEESSLFRHWTDRTNAERMNHWLRLLQEYGRLVQKMCTEGVSLETA